MRVLEVTKRLNKRKEKSGEREKENTRQGNEIREDEKVNTLRKTGKVRRNHRRVRRFIIFLRVLPAPTCTGKSQDSFHFYGFYFGAAGAGNHRYGGDARGGEGQPAGRVGEREGRKVRRWKRKEIGRGERGKQAVEEGRG